MVSRADSLLLLPTNPMARGVFTNGYTIFRRIPFSCFEGVFFIEGIQTRAFHDYLDALFPFPAFPALSFFIIFH